MTYKEIYSNYDHLEQKFRPIDYYKLFGNDSGEDETPSVLANYFVDIPEFKRFLDDSQKLSIVRARKGMGKSALLSYLAFQLNKNNNTLIIRTTGNELIGLADFTSTDQAILENLWKRVICKRICLEMAKQIGFAVSDDQISLVEAAELEGYKGRNIVSSLTNRLSGIFTSILSLGTNGHNGNLTISPSTDGQSEARLKRLLAEYDQRVWILIDDIDAKYVDDESNQQRVGAFFSALRSLAFNYEGFRIRASVRTDVWTNLRRMEDQDKLRQYIVDIKWSDDTLRNVFTKRILAYLQDIEPNTYSNWNVETHQKNIIQEVFLNKDFYYQTQQVDPVDVVMMCAGRRPRWMGQLCKLAGQRAPSQKLRQSHFYDSMEDFGREKLQDIEKEHIHQFRDLPKLLSSFRGAPKDMTRHKLLELIKRVYLDKLNENAPLINGYPLKETSQLANLLFQIDFIAAQKGNGRGWMSYLQNPDLMDSEENMQNKIKWCVNLSFRGFLGIP